VIPPLLLLKAKAIGSAFVSFIVEWWRELLILGLVLALIHAGAEIRDRNHEIASIKAAQKLAGANSQAKGATTGQEAVTVYVERNEADRPVVERVVERVRNVCLRSQDPVRVPVPESTPRADETAAGAGDGEDRAFVEAIGRDLETCKAELNKLSTLQEWLRANGG
jgi:hypothetical protein